MVNEKVRIWEAVIAYFKLPEGMEILGHFCEDS
jgi:hypothetical protein